MNFTFDLENAGFGKFHLTRRREWKPCRCVNQSLTASLVFANRRFNRIALRGRSTLDKSHSEVQSCREERKSSIASRSRWNVLHYHIKEASRYREPLESLESLSFRRCYFPPFISFLFPRPNSLPRKKLVQNSRVACRSERRTNRYRGFRLARKYTCTHGSWNTQWGIKHSCS